VVKILRRRIRKEEGNEMKFETTEFHCCPAVSRNYGGKTKEIIIIILGLCQSIDFGIGLFFLYPVSLLTQMADAFQYFFI